MIVLILITGAGIVVALASIPSNAFNPGGTPTFTCELSITGTYNDLGVYHDIQPFSAILGSCHQDSLLDLLPAPALNILPFTLTFGVSLIDSNGTDHCTGCSVGISIPALQTSYGFTSSTQISNIPQGTYTLEIQSPYALGSYSGADNYSESVIVGN